eukprot:4618160-Pleurochrysis_carterae.AAC.2
MYRETETDRQIDTRARARAHAHAVCACSMRGRTARTPRTRTTASAPSRADANALALARMHASYINKEHTAETASSSLLPCARLHDTIHLQMECPSDEMWSESKTSKGPALSLHLTKCARSELMISKS